MNTLIIVLAVLILLVALFYVIEKWELAQFKITEYELSSEKIQEALRISLVADLHDHSFGNRNEPLIQAIKESKPNLILIAGDLFTQSSRTDTTVALDFLSEAVKIAPVYYSNGNHETRIQLFDDGKKIWEDYVHRAEELGVHFVNNTEVVAEAAGQEVLISGYEADMRLYAKGKGLRPDPGEVIASIRQLESQGRYRILLAHNPIFFDEYKKTGADLTLSGHMHGGLVRIPGIGSVISPQFELFPKYDAGLFEEDGQHLLISRGLGTHTFNIRVFNRAELVNITVRPE